MFAGAITDICIIRNYFGVMWSWIGQSWNRIDWKTDTVNFN